MPKKYSEEFKAEAVRLMKEKGLSLQQASQELGVNRVSLQKWCEEEHKDPSLELLQKELRRLQKKTSNYQKELKKHELICSMSRAGQCLDNAMAESFFSSLKKELVYAKDLKYATKREAHQNVVDDLLWFNQKRIHSSCQKKSPIHDENQMSRFLP